MTPSVEEVSCAGGRFVAAADGAGVSDHSAADPVSEAAGSVSEAAGSLTAVVKGGLPTSVVKGNSLARLAGAEVSSEMELKSAYKVSGTVKSPWAMLEGAVMRASTLACLRSIEIGAKLIPISFTVRP